MTTLSVSYIKSMCIVTGMTVPLTMDLSWNTQYVELLVIISTADLVQEYYIIYHNQWMDELSVENNHIGSA